MKKKKSSSSFIILFLGLSFFLIVAGCTPVTPTPGKEVLLQVPSNIGVIENDSVTPTSGTLLVEYGFSCSCVGNQIIVEITLEAFGGTPPYVIPGYEFVEKQTFRGNLGNVYSITIRSSDEIPFTWSKDIKLECDSEPVCPVPTDTPIPTNTLSPTNTPLSTDTPAPINIPTNTPRVRPDDDNPSPPPKSTDEPPPAESVDEPSPAEPVDEPPPVPECPINPGGNEPPGLCKKN